MTKRERIKRVLRILKESQKAKERPSQKAKVNGPLGHGVKISRMPIGVRKVKKDQIAAKENQHAQFVEIRTHFKSMLVE